MRESAVQESGFRAPGVSDSIEPTTMMEQTRRAGEFLGACPSMNSNVAGGVQKANLQWDGNRFSVEAATHNDVNEITDVSETTGPSWPTPAHDAAGNMTEIPQPADLTSSYTATYDAWNRLVKLEDGANTVAEYEYDGLNRRIVNSIYVSGSLDYRQHVYYNKQWQVLEVRKETGGNEDADPLEQSICHPYYVDALILRDYDEDVDGTSVRHYYAQDANFNVTAVTDDAGSVVERYHYTPYGQLKVLDADFSDDADGASDIANATTFTGRRYDAESGLYYYRNRMYHAELGRFVSRDPIFYEGSKWNLYEYADGVPVSRLDAYGYAPFDVYPYTPPSGPIDDNFCGWFLWMTGNCCTVGQTEVFAQRCKKEGKILTSAYCNEERRFNCWSCGEKEEDDEDYCHCFCYDEDEEDFVYSGYTYRSQCEGAGCSCGDPSLN